MVMGKVSKAIAASFLCLSLFNASGDFASAMKSKMTSEFKTPKNEITNEITNEDEKKKGKGEDKSKNNEEEGKEEGKDTDPKSPDKTEGFPKWATYSIVGFGTFCIGLGAGFVLGKNF